MTDRGNDWPARVWDALRHAEDKRINANLKGNAELTKAVKGLR